MAKQTRHWTYRGERLKQVEWGLWKSVDRTDRYLLCYRPRGRYGPVVRRWVWTGGPNLTVADLRQFVRRIRSEIEARKLGIAVKASAPELVELYKQELTRVGRSEQHRAEVIKTLSDFAEASGLHDITVTRPDQLTAFLGGCRTPRTQNKKRAHLHAFYHWLVLSGHITANPVAAVTKAREERKLVRVLSCKDVVTLIRKAPDSYDRAVFAVLAMTGMRRGSFLSLTADSFTGTGIHVPHTKRGVEWLLSYDAGCPLWGPHLTEIGQRIWSERVPTMGRIRTRWEAISPDFPLKNLRHSFCSWLVQAGESFADVAAWAHHSSVTTTEKWYAHLRAGGRSAANKNKKSVCNMRSHLIKLALCE